MTALECVRTLQKLGWVLTDPGDHAPTVIIPILNKLITDNQYPCMSCNQAVSETVVVAMPNGSEIHFSKDPPPDPFQGATPKKRGRPKKDPFAP